MEIELSSHLEKLFIRLIEAIEKMNEHLSNLEVLEVNIREKPKKKVE